MNEYLPFVVAGLVAGSVYGLAAVGLVLTYRTSGVFNFAHGALATIAAYAFYWLRTEQELAWPVAFVITVGVVGPLVGVAFERLARRLTTAGLALQVGATIGVLLVVQAAAVLVFGQTETRTVDVFFASGHVTVGETQIQTADIVTFVLALVLTGGLSYFLRRARAGLAMRAVVDSPSLLALAGTSPTSTRRLAWVLGATLAAISGVLFSPLLPLDSTVMTLLVVQAFGAAALGAFRNLPLTFAGGLLIGVLSSLSTKWFQTGILASVPPALPFIVLFAVLLVFPRRYLAAPGRLVPLAQPSALSGRTQLLGGLILVGLLAAVPGIAGIHLTDWTTMLATAVVLLSLGLLVRVSGQVSLGHVAFAAVGAAAFSHLSTDATNLPWGLALIGAGLVAVPLGAVLAVPAIRLTGIYLPLATFGFAVLVAYMFYGQDFMFGTNGAALEMPRPSFAEGDKSFFYVVLVVAAIGSVVVIALERTRMGRLLRAMSDAPRALASSGTSVSVTRVLVFCLSAFLAAIGGALIGMSQEAVSSDSYPPLLSLTYLALIVISVGPAPWYAVLAAGVLVLGPSYATGEDTGTWLQLAFGVLVVARSAAAAKRRKRRPQSAVGRSPATAQHDDEPLLPVDDGELRVEVVGVRYGGVVAVDAVSLVARTGSITGLIGPNGAGKTTMFNACSGWVRPANGRIIIDGREVTRAGPDSRARSGLARTFQVIDLFESLTVAENVALGREAGMAGARPLRHVAGRRGDRHEIDTAVARALQTTGLTGLADVLVGELSTGHRRLVELARCLAGDAKLLLLDEPSSGLDAAETVRFGEILRDLVRHGNVGVLLVEHDMSLVMDVCEHIYVLDFGRLVFEGTPAAVVASEVVQTAYLGELHDDVALTALPAPSGGAR